MSNSSETNQNGDPWKSLYWTGAVSALLIEAAFRRYWGVELMTFNGFGIISVPQEWPVSALDWFNLLQVNRFVGLSMFELYDVIGYSLLGLVFLALYFALREAGKSAMVVATSAGLVGVAVYLASNQAFAMLNLSQRYAAATLAEEKSGLLAAGEALLAQHDPGSFYQGTGIYTGTVLVLAAGLIISILMLRSEVFGKWAAIMGILANGLYLLGYVALALAPAIYGIFPPLAAPFRMIWHVLIAVKLFKLASSKPGKLMKMEN